MGMPISSTLNTRVTIIAFGQENIQIILGIESSHATLFVLSQGS